MNRCIAQVLYAIAISFAVVGLACLQCYMTPSKLLIVAAIAATATLITAFKCYRIHAETTSEPAPAGEQ